LRAFFGRHPGKVESLGEVESHVVSPRYLSSNHVNFVILSFEGPDQYSHAGGLGSRVSGLSNALAAEGFETHLFFIGEPSLPGHEIKENGKLHLHRWCQWISRYHPAGVYDGEEGKLQDWNRSLPGWLRSELLAPKVAAGDSVVVLAEEWHTAASILSLAESVGQLGWQSRVHLLWNANNNFGFHRVPWAALKHSAAITVVSRYMKHLLWAYGVDARVIPNGISENWLRSPDRNETLRLSRLFKDRVTLVKVARWDPDKRWEMAIDAVAEIKRLGLRPLFLVRGGLEDHGREVLARAERQGLQCASVRWEGAEIEALTQTIRAAVSTDMILLVSYLSEAQRKVLFQVADAVLANSGVEPFGLVGLEAMAVGGIAFVGSTGEDYVTPGYDAISLQTNDYREIVHHISYLRTFKERSLQLRQAAKRTAARHTWPLVIQRVLFPFLNELGLDLSAPEPAPSIDSMAASRPGPVTVGNPTSEKKIESPGTNRPD
jgi:glycosyltransferase involved in cell wall biosynthesis